MEYRGKERFGSNFYPCINFHPLLEIHSFQVAGKLNLSTATVHLALRIIDLFMDGHDIQAWNHNELDFTRFLYQEPQLYLVCLGALLLASKMEER